MEADSKETGPNYEQRHWEEEHLKSALLKFGAKDAKLKTKVSVSQYADVFLVQLAPGIEALSGSFVKYLFIV